MLYNNPILPGFYPDPSICKVKNTYYLINSTFEYLPGIPIFQSTDLIHWSQIGHCITRDSQINIRNCRCSGGIFAPTLRHHNGTFYMITTDIEKGTFILTTDDITSEWSDPLLISCEGYDPSLYFENDRTYLQISARDEMGYGVYQAELDITTGNLLSSFQLLWRGTGGRDPEGPHIFSRNGYYYLNIAEGGTREGHMITLARSKNLWGPFESCPHNPVLTNREEPEIPLQAVGHADYFTDIDGNWWLVALCQRPLEHFFHHLGRETILVPLTWQDDWPDIGINGHVYPQMEGPLPAISTPISAGIVPVDFDTFDDFNESSLPHHLFFMRSFLQDHYSLKNRPGWLQLTSNENSLNTLASPAFVLRRQQHFYCSFKAKMEFNPDTFGEAGLCVYYDNAHHFELGIKKINTITTLFVRKNVADICVITNTIPFAADVTNSPTIYLEVRATPTQYYFCYGYNEDCCNELDHTVTKHLSTESAYSDFVGVCCGMYAVSTCPDHPAQVYFDWFSYTGKEPS